MLVCVCELCYDVCDGDYCMSMGSVNDIAWMCMVLVCILTSCCVMGRSGYVALVCSELYTCGML